MFTSSDEGDEVIEAETDSDIGDDSDIMIQDSGIEVEPSQEPAADEGEKRELENLTRKYNARTPAELRLIQDLRTLQRVGEKSLGFRANPIDMKLDHWSVQIFEFDKNTEFFRDMQKYKKMCGRDYIEMSLSFPPDYPFSPPFARILTPRFQYRTGHVTLGGSLCMDILTSDGWNPMYEISSIISNIIAQIISGNPRVDLTQATVPYPLSEAKDGYIRMATQHGWKIPKWLPK